MAKQKEPELEGLKYLQKGICFTPEQDRAVALGWPHFIDLTEDEVEVPDIARRSLLTRDAVPRRVMNKGVAAALSRAYGQLAIFDLAPGFRSMRKEPEEAIWNARPMEADEARKIIRRRLRSPLLSVTARTMYWLLPMIEAQVGTLTVVDGALDTLEGMDRDGMRRNQPLAPRLTYSLGSLLLRLSPDQAAEARNRMLGILGRNVDFDGPLTQLKLPRSENSHARALHLVLHGATAAESSTDQDPEWYRFAGDDPQVVKMRVAICQFPYELDARLIALAGTSLLRWYDKRWAKEKNALELRWFVEQLAPFKGARVVETMLALSVNPLGGSAARDWLADHREFILGDLKAIAGGTGANAQRAATELLRGE